MNLASLLNADSCQGMARTGLNVELNGQLSQSWYQFPPAEDSTQMTSTRTSSPSYMPVHHDHRTTLFRASPDPSGSLLNSPNGIPDPLSTDHPTGPGPEPSTSALRLSPNDSASDEELVEEDVPPRKRRRQGLSCLECKKRKVRCDRTRPQCGPCARRNPTSYRCQWHVLPTRDSERTASPSQGAPPNASNTRLSALQLPSFHDIQANYESMWDMHQDSSRHVPPPLDEAKTQLLFTIQNELRDLQTAFDLECHNMDLAIQESMKNLMRQDSSCMQKGAHEMRVLIARFRDFIEVKVREKLDAIWALVYLLLPSRDPGRLPSSPHTRNIPPMAGPPSAAPPDLANTSHLHPLVIPPTSGNYGPSPYSFVPAGPPRDSYY